MPLSKQHAACTVVQLDRVDADPSGSYFFSHYYLTFPCDSSIASKEARMQGGLQCWMLRAKLAQPLSTALKECEKQNIKVTKNPHGLDIATRFQNPEMNSNVSFILHGLESWNANFPNYLSSRFREATEVLCQ